jgi:hypothetical protein
MKIIAFTGPSGAGKTISASSLVAYIEMAHDCEVQYLRVKEPLLKAAEALNPRLFAHYDTLSDPGARHAARDFLCDLGKLLDRHFPLQIVEHLAITLRALQRANLPNGLVVILDDLRRPAELDLLREEFPAETTVIYLDRPANTHPRQALDGLISPEQCDLHLLNDDTPEHLAERLEKFADVILETGA